MRTKAREEQFVVSLPVDQYEIGMEMTISICSPFASQRVIAQTLWELLIRK
jgi:hypothetical protein